MPHRLQHLVVGKPACASPKYWQPQTNAAKSLSPPLASPFDTCDCFRLDRVVFSDLSKASMPRRVCSLNVLLFSWTDVCTRGRQMCRQSVLLVSLCLRLFKDSTCKENYRSDSIKVVVKNRKILRQHNRLCGLVLSDRCRDFSAPQGVNWVWALISTL